MIAKLLSLIFGKKSEPTVQPSTNPHRESVKAVEVRESAPEPKQATVSDYERYQNMADQMGAKDNGEFDADTLHGQHYTPQEYQEWVDIIFADMKADEEKDSGGALTDEHIARLLCEAEKQTFSKWNPSSLSNLNRTAQFSQRAGVKMSTGSAMPMDQVDPNDPLFAPINGVSIEDYGAINARLAAVSVEDIAALLGIEVPALSEAISGWTTRMQGDATARLATVMSTSFANVDNHPKLGAAKRELSGVGAETMVKIEADKMYLTELRAYQTAASEAGLDANQYLVDTYGITTAELMGAYAKTRNMSGMNTDFEALQREDKYFEQKKAEAAKMFAKQVGGGVADDVAF